MPLTTEPHGVSGQIRTLAGADTGEPQDTAFWFELIPEREAAKFLNLSVRTLQAWRQKGEGPSVVYISSRCLRYRRCDLREWAEARARASTSARGPEADAA